MTDRLLVLRAVAGPDRGGQVVVTDSTVVGRESPDLSIADPAMSRRHLCVTATGAGAIVTDLGSSGGTRVDGRLVEGTADARIGSTIVAGRTSLLLLSLRSFGAPVPDGRSSLLLVSSTGE